MPLNGLIDQLYLPKVAILNSVLQKYKTFWAGASTLEERLGVEASALGDYEQLVEDDTVLDLVSRFEHLDKFDLEAFYNLYELFQKSNNARISKLMEMYLARDNNATLSLNEILGQIKRIKQKHAVLNLWDNDKIRFFTSENFLTIEGLGDQYISAEQCEVNTNQGMLVLPVQLKERVDIARIKIGAASNGQAGSSDLAVTSNNQSISALTSVGSPTDWFEYERMDGGPCKLTLIAELLTPNIINSITIVPVNIGVPLSFEIEDILFTTSGKESISIFDLFPKEYPQDFFNIPIASFTEGWEIGFLPVEATSVTFKFSQSQAYQIDSIASDGRSVYRDRYVIPIQTVALFKTQYKAEGAINSLPIPIRKNLYALESVIQVSPDNFSFFDLALEVSFDDGGTWRLAGTEEDAITNVITNNEGSFIWRVLFIRNSDAFSTFSSFFNSEPVNTPVKSILKSVSRFSSPTKINLSSSPKDNSVYAIQPKIGRRGLKAGALRLGAAVTGATKLRLPFNILKSKVRFEELKMYVGGIEYVRKQPGEFLSGEEWTLSDDYNEVVLPFELPVGTIVDLLLTEESMILEEREDGYYHFMKLEFDPDKPNIEIRYLARDPSRGSILVDRSQTIISLNVGNVFENSVVITSAAGNVYNEVISRDLVYDEVNYDYYVDYQNGIVYLAQIVGDDNVRISFDYQEKLSLEQEDFKITYLGNRPSGIKINKDALEARSVEERLGNNLLKIINLDTGTYAKRNTIIPTGSTTKRQLSYDCIIKNTFTAPTNMLENDLVPEEVTYIDGQTEFLGLTLIEGEKTLAIAAGGSGNVSFALSARSLWYTDLDVTFSNTSVFANKKNSVSAVETGSIGDYFITSDGFVHVRVGNNNSLTAGIRLSYYFKNELFDPTNKFSIDYDSGILYTHAVFNPNATIKYKSACYRVSYDLAREIKNVSYNSSTNAIEVRTENLDPLNNLVKVIWQEQPVSLVDSTLQDYFSPLVSSIGFRFS